MLNSVLQITALISFSSLQRAALVEEELEAGRQERQNQKLPKATPVTLSLAQTQQSAA